MALCPFFIIVWVIGNMKISLTRMSLINMKDSFLLISLSKYYKLIQKFSQVLIYHCKINLWMIWDCIAKSGYILKINRLLNNFKIFSMIQKIKIKILILNNQKIFIQIYLKKANNKQIIIKMNNLQAT